MVIISSFVWFRTKDLRPEAKNFEVFFVHTVSHSLRLSGWRWPCKLNFIRLRRIFAPVLSGFFPRQIRLLAWNKLRLSEALRSIEVTYLICPHEFLFPLFLPLAKTYLLPGGSHWVCHGMGEEDWRSSSSVLWGYDELLTEPLIWSITSQSSFQMADWVKLVFFCYFFLIIIDKAGMAIP